jgi:hypothetical protein
MATIKESPIGVVSGKLGQIAGAKWKGINYLRVIPSTVTNPRTDKQLSARLKFGVVSSFTSCTRQFLKIGFKNWAVKMTPSNAASSYNIKHAVSGTYPNFIMDYPNVLVSRGEVASTFNQAVTSTVSSTITFTWHDNSDEMNADPSDKTLLLIYDPIKHQSVYVNGLTTRDAETETITVPKSFSGDMVQCYIAFINGDESDVSNSAYAGGIIVS